MKRASLILALALSFAAVSPIFAANQTKDTKANKSSTAKEPKKTKPQSSSKQIALTGSYIKRDTNHNGLVTDGPNPVYVLDRKLIETSGAADLSQMLFRSGFRH